MTEQSAQHPCPSYLSKERNIQHTLSRLIGEQLGIALKRRFSRGFPGMSG
jgi:hypothetical protein